MTSGPQLVFVFGSRVLLGVLTVMSGNLAENKVCGQGHLAAAPSSCDSPVLCILYTPSPPLHLPYSYIFYTVHTLVFPTTGLIKGIGVAQV